MPDMTNPELLKTPLAKNGDKNTLPLTTGATTGLFSQDLGFQEINSTPLTAGGKAPDRKDMNAAVNLLGGVAFMAQKGWTFHYDSSQDYYLGCVVIDPADGNRYECIANMAAGTVAPHEDADGDYWRRYTLGDGEAVGVIKAFAGNGDIPAGYLLCDGDAVSRTMFPDLFAAIGTTYGSGDGSTTFNLPDYNTAQRFAQGGTVAGVEKAAGLPNIAGTAYLGDGSFSIGTGVVRDANTGAFFAQGRYTSHGPARNSTAEANMWRQVLNFDASRSNPIYGNSDTVQPNALTTRYIIKAFDGQTADSALIDITQYAQRLEEKADINGSNLVYHKDVITTSGTYTAPVTGLYKITIKGGGGGGAGGYIDSSLSMGGGGGGEGGTTIAYEKLEVGDTATIVVGAGGTKGNYNSNGSQGGSSTVTINLTTYTGGGGNPGLTYSSIAGGAGGSGTIMGAPGAAGTVNYYQAQASGGSGGGAGGGRSSRTNAATSATMGGGGAGGAGNNTVTGNDGGDGFVWFEYYTPGA